MFNNDSRSHSTTNLTCGASLSSTGEIMERIQEGKSITRAEASELLYLDGDPVISAAGRIRNRTKPGIVTYSRKVFINLINLCRDTCSYCTYKKEPGDPAASMMAPRQVLAIAEAGQRHRCTEALFVTGEKPEQKYPEARAWLKSHGCSSTVEYIEKMSELVIKNTGLLPHTNAGSLTKKEMALLQDTNVSLGSMLESSSERLLERGMPHEDAPSKNPKVRIKTLEDAGQLKIPMTTGILVGIGETPDEIIDSLFVIKELHQKYGHIQEVIVQNFAPKPGTKMAGCTPVTTEYLAKVAALARIIMPEVNIQVPPNLNPKIFGRYIDAGVNDWGGISPVTVDHVNPEFPWPSIDSVKRATEAKGFKLRARLPVYPEFLEFVPEPLRQCAAKFSDTSGLVREDFLN